MTNKRLLDLLEAFKKLRITVVGDFILDRYMIGDTERVSREAPVLVISYRETAHHPGGAANAAQNITALSAAASVVGVTGDDSDGGILCDLLESRSVDITGLVRSADLETAVKLRIMAGELHAQRQQIVRIDRSYQIGGNSALIGELVERFAASVRESHAVLISDYGMGVVPGPVSRSAIQAGRSMGIPVVVDSRYNLLSYGGATAATPNETEVIDALGSKAGKAPPIEPLTDALLEAADLEGVIVTRGSVGMFIREPGRASQTIGIVGSNEATDVTGAGDTVSAVAALSLAAGASLIEAAEMATYAASVVVMKRGTASVSPEELRERLGQYPISTGAG